MNLDERWRSTLAQAELADPEGTVLRELEALYSESHRKYHDLEHVKDCLRHLDAHPLEGTDPIALELAIWFHDAIYAPLKGNNEAASADLATARLTALGAEEDLRKTVHRLILVTQHDHEPNDPDEALLLDIDLSILGGERERFEVYESAIRQEYRLVPGPLYRRKRKAILRSFLARPVLYHTAPFRESEARARDNLEWAISRL
jgi:predicted metal-dependent HD superfamily phosphohydrolase